MVIIGKIRNLIYRNNENGYTIAIFRVDKTELEEAYSITVAGIMIDFVSDVSLKLDGNIVFNEKYKKKQFDFVTSEVIMPSSSEKIIEFLTSPVIKGCGKATAKKLVDLYGEDTLEKIKDLNLLIKDAGLSEKLALKINGAIIKYSLSAEYILKLQDMGFSINEASVIFNKYQDGTLDMIDNHYYKMREVVDFKKLDYIYLKEHNGDDEVRIYACILESMSILSNKDGHTFYYVDQIVRFLVSNYTVHISSEEVVSFLNTMEKNKEVVIVGDYIYLKEFFDYEVFIGDKLKKISSFKDNSIVKFDEKIKRQEEVSSIEFDSLQKNAIKNALTKKVCIISGGPGTGKTTILKSIVNLYIDENKLSREKVPAHIALLAPTGRAAKRMGSSTNLPSYTIHRFLKARAGSDEFEYNEDNKVIHKLIIIDECSMLDVKLFTALLKALPDNVTLVLVGDEFQLPAVGPGLVYTSLIGSDMFDFIKLTKIFRQSENSFIPDLALMVKNEDASESCFIKHDDYNFFECDPSSIREYLTLIVTNALNKGINEEDMQVLVPLYNGDNGITNINQILRGIYNKQDFSKREIVYGSITYREGDKVLVLVNDVDKNVFNGDIGYITKIYSEDKKDKIRIRFDNVSAIFDKKNLANITHGYAISVHKSQGSEFNHIIMPICSDYYMMMYNKLLYTGLTRAKKSLILVGQKDVFVRGIKNKRSDERNSSLKDTLISIICKNE